MSIEGTPGISSANEMPHSSEASTGPRSASSSPGDGERATVRNLKELKEKAPEIWNAMLKTMASEMTAKMRKNQDRLKKVMREGQRR